VYHLNIRFVGGAELIELEDDDGDEGWEIIDPFSKEPTLIMPKLLYEVIILLDEILSFMIIYVG